MQLDLFDSGNIARNSFRENLSVFDLQGAVADLQALGKTLNAGQEIDRQITLLSELKENLPAETNAFLRFSGKLYMDFARQTLAGVLGDDARFLKEGLAAAMCGKMDENNYDYIIPGLHPAELFLAVKNFSAAEHAATTFLKQKEEDSRVRQLQACALYALGKENSAFTAYTFAFFNHPQACRAEYIQPPVYRHKYEYLLRKYEQEKEALIRLPFALWQSGLTYIATEAYAFERLLQKQIQKHKKKTQRTAAENILQFNRFLYLAESERLRLGRQNTSDKLHELQQNMQELNEEMFAAYVNILKSFRNI